MDRTPGIGRRPERIHDASNGGCLVRRFVAIIVVGAGCAEAPPDPLPPDGLGPYRVSATTRTFVDARGIELTIEVWYPATPAVGAEPEGYGDLSLVRDAYRDAPLDPRGAPYPLVAFSHGYGGVRYQSTFLTEHLASHGFVVVAPDHPHNTLFDLDEDRTAEVAVNRPGDVSSAVDEVVAMAGRRGRLAGAVTGDVFGMIGHSFGAWTTLAISGGVLDAASAATHCAASPTAGCGFFELDGVDTSAARPDDRVAATVALAPGAVYTFADTQDITDALIVGGRLDSDMPYDSEIRPTYDALPAPKRLMTLARTGHWSFTDLCELVTVLEDCGGEDDGYTDFHLVQRWTNTVVTAALRRRLLDDAGAVAWLGQAAWDGEPDVSWEEAGTPDSPEDDGAD